MLKNKIEEAKITGPVLGKKKRKKNFETKKGTTIERDKRERRTIICQEFLPLKCVEREKKKKERERK